MDNIINKDIIDLLPHGEPFIFVDKIISVDGLNKITASRTINKNASYLKGHFPENPILPGVLLVESMAQTAGVICSYGASAGKKISSECNIYFLTRIVDIRFKHPVFPGSTLILKAEILNTFNDVVKTRVEAEVDGKIVAEGELVLSKTKQKRSQQ